jgi:predicted RNase H-like HicB family nuclease
MQISTEIAARGAARTYVFPIDLTPETDGRWSATCPTLPGCATWARSREDALRNIQEAIEAYVDDVLDSGEKLPAGARMLDHVAVTVTV